MSLKHELQNLTPEKIKTVSDSLTARLDSLSEQELQQEALAAIVAYPALNELVCLVSDQALAEELPIEEVVARGTGASQAILVLTTIADIDELPSL